MNLQTSYLGLPLRSPLVASASPVSQTIDGVRAAVAAGVGAVVMYSLFEEQILSQELTDFDLIARHEDVYGEASSYFPDLDLDEFGGTGTGAAPIVAEVARELGVLTVAVVTKPFGFEGKRLKIAEAGIAELQKHVDSLIVILNDRLMDVLGDDVSMDDAFKAADNVLRNAVGGIAEIINFPGIGDGALGLG